MRLFSKKRIHKSVSDAGCVNVSEENGVRTLHLGSNSVQSAMRIGQPYQLELEYSRCMMGFLLFKPKPAHIVSIGLGGGSLAKFIHHSMPGTTSVSVEINPEVVAAARAYFRLPDEDERFRLVIGDGARYVAEHPENCDVLLVDGFNSHSQADELASQEFYDRCAQALDDNGILSVNLWGTDPRHAEYLERIGKSFEQLVLRLPAAHHGNVAALAFKRSPNSPRWDDLRERARELEKQYNLEFLRFVEALREHNLHTVRRLLI